MTAPALAEMAVCQNCWTGCHSTTATAAQPSRGWVHTDTGTVACPLDRRCGDGFVLPMTQTTYEAHGEEALNDAYTTGEETGREDGYAEGVRDEHARIFDALTAAMESVPADADCDTLRDALRQCWDKIAA